MRHFTFILALCLFAVGCNPKSTPTKKLPVTEEALQELREYIRRDVAAGFQPEDAIAPNAVEILSDDYDPAVLTPHAVEMTRELIAAHKREQASWPKTTDCAHNVFRSGSSIAARLTACSSIAIAFLNHSMASSSRADSHKTLQILFDVEEEAITRILLRAEADLATIGEEIVALDALPSEVKTAQIQARLTHLLMVQAHELCRRETDAPEVKIFHVSLAAERVASYAEDLAANKGACAKLFSQMDAIWRRGKLPVERIADTVFAFILRRYHMNDQADLFDKDRVEFDIQREIGRRATFPPGDDKTIEKSMDDHLLKE